LKVSGKDLNFREIIDYLHSQDVTIHSASLEQPSLEDVFLRITGKELRE
jgi:ABC-2 type transport system ATP-binding protein